MTASSTNGTASYGVTCPAGRLPSFLCLSICISRLDDLAVAYARTGNQSMVPRLSFLRRLSSEQSTVRESLLRCGLNQSRRISWTEDYQYERGRRWAARRTDVRSPDSLSLYVSFGLERTNTPQTEYQFRELSRNELKTARIDGLSAVSPDILVEGFWTAIEQSEPAIAFPGLCLSEEWPIEPRHAPVWAQVPAALQLRAASSARRDSRDADQALFMLARHVLFGLLLQIFILESLDRELGHDSLVLTHSDQNESEAFANVRVFYRPTRESDSDTDPSLKNRPTKLGALTRL